MGSVCAGADNNTKPNIVGNNPIDSTNNIAKKFDEKFDEKLAMELAK